MNQRFPIVTSGEIYHRIVSSETVIRIRDSISQIDPSLQELIEAIENASTLTLLILSAWHLARVLAVRIVEEALTERAQRPTQWLNCPKCGKRMHSKGFVSRQITSVIGIIRWKRRVGRCPYGCKIGQISPLDDGDCSLISEPVLICSDWDVC